MDEIIATCIPFNFTVDEKHKQNVTLSISADRDWAKHTVQQKGFTQ